MPPLTLYQAAKLSGRAKATVQDAIKKGRLSAHKNQFGRYEIDPAELNRVYPIAAPEQPPPSAADIAEYKGRIATLEATISGLQAVLTEVKGERDDQRATVASLRAQLSPPNRGSILERIFGRKAA